MTWLTPLGGVWRIIAVVSTCALVLTGCAPGTGGETGESGKAGPSSAAPSQSSTVQMSGGYVLDTQGRPMQPERSWPDLTRDPLMDEETPEGVEAFARYFVAVAERAWNTGDTTELETISSQECSYCTNLTKLIKERYGTGYWVDGLQYDISRAGDPILYPQSDLKYAIFLHLQVRGIAYSDGRTVRPVSHATQQLELQACRRDSVWIACGAIGSNDDS